MVSSLHPADDPRIVEKEARSLAAAGYRVTVVARPPAPSDRGNIEFKLINTSVPGGWKRRRALAREAFALARTSRPDVVQFHDPELIFSALAMRGPSCRIVYDVHEDVPADIHSKTWIPGPLRLPAAALAGIIERLTARRFDAIVAATPTIADRFRRYGGHVVLVRNSVKLTEFTEAPLTTTGKRQAVYVGRISFDRGLREMVEGCRAISLPLAIAGNIGPEEESWLTRNGAGVTWRGKLDRAGIAALLNESSVGISLLHPEPNFLHAFPTKIFEYMAAALPIVTSNLPASKAIVEQASCGIAVAHDDAEAVKKALSALSQGEAARNMGLRGRKAVFEQYNWARDADALVGLYKELAPGKPAS